MESGGLNKWVVVVGALIALGTVAGDLGLTLTIPGFSVSVKNSVVGGASSLTKANASFTVNETLDASGAVTALRSVVLSLYTPLANTLAAIQSASSDKTTNPTELFQNLNDQLAAASTGISDASATAASLELVTKPTWYSQLMGNLSSLSDQMSSFNSLLVEVSIAVDQVLNADPQYTSNNVSLVITPAMTNTITGGIKTALSTISNIANVITLIGRDKQTAVSQQAFTNNTFNNSLRTLVAVVTQFNKTVSNVESATIRVANLTLKGINSTYTTILARPSSFNNGDMTNLTTFLDSTTTINETTLAIVETISTTLKDTVTMVMNEQTSNIGNTLTNAIRNISDQTSTSTSVYAAACSAKYSNQLNGMNLAVSRLAPCVNSEIPSFQSLLATVSVQFNEARASVSATAAKLNLCTIVNGACSVSYFANFDDYSVRLRFKLTVVGTIVTADEYAIMGRVTNCLVAVSNDIQEQAQLVQNRYGNCLVVGV